LKNLITAKKRNIRFSNRSETSFAFGMSLHMECLLKGAGQELGRFSGKKSIFEINPDHALVQRMKVEQDDTRFADLTQILFDQAILSEGGHLDDPAAFVHKLN
jgi:molecular chaperone HtpG